MSRIDSNFVKQLYSQAGVELTPEKLNHISNNYSSNEELKSAFELKYGSINVSTPEKKNSDVTSVSTSEAPQSESQQPQKKASSLSVGGKPKKTGASASSTGGGKKVGGKEVKKESKSEDLISKFGFKNKEEQNKAGVEASKVKIDAKTPSTVKPVSVKEEQFVKPELQKIQKEFSSPKFKKELEENKESILSKEQRDLISSGIDSGIEMKQAEGLLPPTSELIKSGDIKLNIFSGGNIDELLNPKSFTEMLDQQSKPFVDQVKESNKPVKINYDDLILANDYNLPNPYLYYSNSKNGGDNQVNELYTDNLSNLPINKDDFDGFLRKRGLLDDFNKDLSSGLYNEDRGTFSENYNAKLIKEKRLVDFLSMYISDRNQRDYDKRVIEYKKENPKATAEDINRNVSKFTFVSDRQFDDYIKNTFPTYTKSIEERKIKEKEQWEETKKNKGDFFSWQTLKKIGSGISETISSRVSNLSSTVYDLIGMEDAAKQIRFSAEEDAFNRPENRDISYVSGKKVVYNDNEYLVDSNGQIYDYNLKKRVTDLFTNTDYKLITKAAEKGEDDNLFSWTGATVQTINVLADLALQIALTRGAGAGGNIVKSGLSKEGLSILSKIPVSQGMASSATAQTFLGYSEGLENTLVAAKEAGISDSEAKALANDAAMKTAGLYLVTSGISPQTKASFVKKKNELIKEAIDVYAKKGKSAYIKFLNKGINGLKEFFEEGTKETFQEVIQQAGTVYGVNQSINEQAGKEILQSEMTADEIISMLPSTFIAGGMPIMLRNVGGTFSKKDYLSNLDVASNNVDLSNKRLDELLSNNVITSEEHSKSKEDLRVYSQNKNKIPKDTSAEIVLDVAKGLDEISKLESQKQNLDKAFHSDIDEKIEKKREQIKDLYKKDKENESNKQTTGQVSEQEKPATTTETETTDTTQQKTELQSQEKISTTPKTETDAVQEQTTSKVPVQPETETSGKVEQGESKTKPEESSEQGQEEKVKLQPKNIRDLYKANRNLFGLDRIKSLSSAIVMDRMVDNMAKRAGIDKKEMYNKLKIEKASKAPKKSLKQENTPFDSNERAEKNISDMFEYLPYGDIKSFTNSIKIGDEDIVFEIYGEKMYLPNTVAKSLMGVISLNKEVFELTAGMRKEDISIYDKQFSSDKSYFEKLRGSIIKSLNDSKDLYEKRLSKKMDSQLSEGDVGFEEIQKISKKIDMVNSFLSKIESEYFTPNEITVKHKGNTVLFQKSKGAMLAEDGSFIIYALTDPNVSTPLHEMAHVFEHYLSDKEKSIVIKESGTNGWTVDTSEYFARGFEKYLSEGIAPTKALQKIFDLFKEWLLDIYNGIKGSDIDIKLNKPMKKLYDSMVSDIDSKSKVKLQEEVTKPKTEKDAVQKQITDEGVLQPKQSEMGLQEMEQGDQVNQETTEQGEEKVKLQQEVQRASDRLSKAFDAYKNISIVFDPEGNWKKDKELMSSLVDFAVSNIKFGTYNVKNLIEDLAKKGIEITTENAKFVMDRANKAFKRGIEKSVGVKPKSTEQKRINKAFDIGVATEKKSNKEKTEVKKEKESSKKQINKAKSDISKAKTNLKKAKIGKLSEDGSIETVIQNKVLNLLFLDPKIVKDSVDEDTFNEYLSYLDVLSKKDIVLKNTPIDEINKLYDKIKPIYNESVSSMKEKDSSEGLSEEDAFEKEENKKEAIKAERSSIKSKLPSVKSIFKNTDVEKSSYEFKILESFANLDDSDIDLIDEKKLKNVNRILRSLVEDGVLVGKAGDLYSEVMSIKTFLAAKESVGASFKEGVYKGGLGKVLFNLKGLYEFPSVLFNTATNVISGRKSEPIRIQIIKKRMLSGTADNIEKAYGLYSKDPFYKSVMSVLGKSMSYIYADEADVNDIMTDVVRSVYSYKKPFEVQLKILYAAIQEMAKSNPGSTSSVDAIEYLKSSVTNENSPYVGNPDTLEKLEKFISDIENKVGFVENDNGELEFTLTKEENSILNNITGILQGQSGRVYEMMIYQNQNAFPMIDNYYPVPYVSKQSTKTDIETLKSRMTSPSTKSARLLEKKGTAHPIGLNPFQTVYSAVKQNSLQFHLRNELIGILDGLSRFREEAVKNKDVDAQVFAETAKNVVESLVDLIVNKTVYENDTMYSLFLDNLERLAYHRMLASSVSRSVDFVLNDVLAISTGYNPAKNSKFYDKVNDIMNEVDKDGTPMYDENRKPILLRRLFKNLEASNINKMVSDKFSSSGRREFVTRGVDKSLIKTDLPSKGDVLSFKVKEKMSPITAINTSIVEFSDLKPYAQAWLSYFLNEFENVSGKELDVELAFKGDAAYLRDNNKFIKEASTFANKQASDFFSSNNVFESSTAIQTSRKGKDLKNALANMIKGSLYFLTGFEMRSAAAMTASINKLIEERTKDEFIKLTTNSARFIAYGAVQQGVVSLLSMLFKSDDEDEEKIKDGFSELWDDEEFVLKSFEYVNFFENNKDLIEGENEIPQDILNKLEEYRKFFRGNKKFVEIMESYRGFLVRDLFDVEIVSMIQQLNDGNERFYIGLTDEWFKMIEDGKVGPDDLMKTYATVFSDYGFKGEDRMKWQDLIEKTLASNKDYIYKATLDQSNKNVDDAILDNAMTLFSKYRNESFSDKLLENSMVTVLNTMFTTRSNRLVKGGYNYLYEQLNKAKIESERGDGGYDYYKDNVFRPITSYGLLKDNKNWKASSELLSIINPALQGISKASLKNQPLEVLTFSKTLGTIGGNDLIKIKNKLSRDEVYKETAGKFQKNTLLDFSLRKVVETEQQKKDRLLKESFPKTKIIPKGSGKTRIAAESSDRFGSNTNKKVGGRELRGE